MKEQELEEATKEYGEHILFEAKLIHALRWLTINLPEKHKEINELRAKLNEMMANRPAQPGTVTIHQEEYDKLNELALNPPAHKCEWRYHASTGRYTTGCDKATTHEGSLPLYCQFCGGKIEI